MADNPDNSAGLDLEVAELLAYLEEHRIEADRTGRRQAYRGALDIEFPKLSAFIREAAGVREQLDNVQREFVQLSDSFVAEQNARAEAEKRLAEAEALLKKHRWLVAELVKVGAQYEELPVNSDEDHERLLIYAMDLPRIFDVAPSEANPQLPPVETKACPECGGSLAQTPLATCKTCGGTGIPAGGKGAE